MSEQAFTFSPVEYINIHRRLFEGLYPFAGRIRDYNISKKEWVLQGDSVLYTAAGIIRETLDYDFRVEKEFSYQTLSIPEAINHLAKFISGLWQIHPFGEGNTRTTAVFTIKYLRSFGFDIRDETFARHSWYFRNALIRANYKNLSKGIYATTEYIEAFLRNLILSENHELKNRALLVKEASPSDMAPSSAPRCKKCTLDCTLEELDILNFLRTTPTATQKALAAHLGKSEKKIKAITVRLVKKGIPKRRNGKRNGFWVIR